MDQQKRNKLLKISTSILSVIIVGLFGFVILYDQLIFSDCRDYFDHSLEESTSSYTNIPTPLREIVYLTIGKRRVRSHLIQMTLSNQLKQTTRMIDWHANYYLCDWFVNFFYSEDEILYLWCNQAPYEGGGFGLNQSALYHFDRELKDLSVDELASIVVIAKAPTRYEKDSKQLDTEVKRVLKEYRSHRTD